MKQRRTKIIATLGPAMDDVEVLRSMLQAGVNVVRANFSHGEAAAHQARIDRVRTVATELGLTVGVLADLQGPKIRIARFAEGPVTLVAGAKFSIDPALPRDVGDQTQVGTDYAALPSDVSLGDILLIDDGRLRLSVEAVQGTAVQCRVLIGGPLSNDKGLNLLGGGLTAPSITQKDQADIETAAALGVDYIALSFPKSAEDIELARRLVEAAGCKAGIVAKIERQEAVDDIERIIASSDGVMVARGDLAIEIGDAEVPAVQKWVIKRARQLGKPVIIATQMMESMIVQNVPTRAEVSDVANAVLDGADAVMLSAETAVGAHPIAVIDAVARVCLAAEKHPSTHPSEQRLNDAFARVDEAIAMAAMYLANHLSISAIIALTESGATALWMSRIRSDIPIYGISPAALSCGKMALYRDVYPICFDVVAEVAPEDINRTAVNALKSRGLVNVGDTVVLTRGETMAKTGSSNVVMVLEVL